MIVWKLIYSVISGNNLKNIHVPGLDKFRFLSCRIKVFSFSSFDNGSIESKLWRKKKDNQIMPSLTKWWDFNWLYKTIPVFTLNSITVISCMSFTSRTALVSYLNLKTFLLCNMLLILMFMSWVKGILIIWIFTCCSL